MKAPYEGMQTPWGVADSVEMIAEGIYFASTPSHGGFWLSRERYATMPTEYRGKVSGPRRWFEEDCEALLVVASFPSLFSPTHVTHAIEAIPHWFKAEVTQ